MGLLLPHEVLADVRYGSLGDMAARLRHVRFTPNSGHKSGHRLCPLSAISDHSHRSK